MSYHFSGTGPGMQTEDGCSVELYRRPPIWAISDVMALFAPTGSSVLELGCGTGRLSGHLADAALRVTEVDSSAQMLAALPPHVCAVESSIESLNLAPLLLERRALVARRQTGSDLAPRCADARHLWPTGALALRPSARTWAACARHHTGGESTALHA